MSESYPTPARLASIARAARQVRSPLPRASSVRSGAGANMRARSFDARISVRREGTATIPSGRRRHGRCLTSISPMRREQFPSAETTMPERPVTGKHHRFSVSCCRRLPSGSTSTRSSGTTTQGDPPFVLKRRGSCDRRPVGRPSFRRFVSGEKPGDGRPDFTVGALCSVFECGNFLGRHRNTTSRKKEPHNTGLDLTEWLAAQSVLRPLCLRRHSAAQPHVGLAEKS